MSGELVAAALARFEVRPRRVRSLARDVYRVDTEDRRRLALRLRPVADRVFGDIPLELAWTAALRRDTEIEPPEALPGADGCAVQEVDGHDCVLFSWVPGTELEHRLSPENARRLGVLSARLHEHAATFRPPPELPVRLLDRLTRGAERDVLSERGHGQLVPPARRRLFREVADRCQAELAALYAHPTGRRVIHSDLHHENVKVHRGKLHPLDFYEVIWGYPVQDVSLTLYDLRYFAKAGDTIEAAFREGYESRLAWPEQRPGQLDLLVAGRLLRRGNWVLEHQAGRVDDAVLEPFFAWLDAELRSLV